MEVTTIGWILIPVAIILFFFSKRGLLYATIFFIPFIATAVINVKALSFGLQPCYLFMFLLLMRCFIELLGTGELEISSNPVVIKLSIGTSLESKSTKFLFYYVIICILSLVMPFIISGSESAVSPEGIIHSIRLSRVNFTQIFYLIFVVSSFVIFNLMITNIEQLKLAFKIFIFSVLFVSLWGIYQFLASDLGIYYVRIFNNSLSWSHADYPFFILFRRVNSVAPEPSMFANYLLSVFPLLLVPLIDNQCLFSWKLYGIGSLLVFVALISTISTTAITGLIIFVVVFSLLSLRLRQLSGLIKKLLIMMAILGIVGIIFNKVISDFINQGFFANMAITGYQKFALQTSSGIGRFNAFREGMRLLRKYPILGVGFGSVRTSDLISTQLAMTGFIGFSFLILFFLFIIKDSWIAYKQSDDKTIKSMCFAVIVSILIMLGVMGLSVPDLAYMHIWFILSLALCLQNIVNSEESRKTHN